MKRVALFIALCLCCGSGPPRDSTPPTGGFRTYALLAGRDTVAIEYIWNVWGGYQGKIYGAVDGSRVPWILYHVWLGPDDTVSRIRIAMTSMVDREVKDFTPLVVARRDRDSVVIQPASPEVGAAQRRFAVSRDALLGMGYSAASWEQALRRGRRMGRKAAFQIVEPMNGQIWEATVTELGGGSVELSVPPEVWRFTLDARGEISRGSDSMGTVLVRLAGDER